MVRGRAGNVLAGCEVLWTLELFVLGRLAHNPSFRRLVQAQLVNLQGDAIGNAAGLAACIGGSDPEATLQTARSCFRYVLLSDISYEDLADSKPNKELFNRSREARIGDVDAFISHSVR